MRNRWFHAPRLHGPHAGLPKRVTWLELFYDLIFVAAFIQLGNGLAEDVSLERFLVFAGMFVPLWTAWSGYAYYVNRFTIDDFLHRLLVFAKMFCVGAMAIAAPRVLDGEPHMFALTFAITQAILVLLQWRAWRQVPEARAYTRYWAGVFAIGAVVWLLAVFVPAPACYGLWALGLLAVLAAPASKASRALQDQFPLDLEHLAERYGLLTLIVLGESFVKVLSSLAGAGGYAVMQAIGTLIITCCLWWIYFDDVAGARLKKQRFSWVVWLYAHLPLQTSLVATGVAIKKAVHFELDRPAPTAYRWLMSGTLALVFFSVGVIDSVTERHQAELSDRARVRARYGSCVMMLLLAPAGAGMSAGWYLALVMSLCVGQVLFDMMMAPLEVTAETEQARPIAELARRDAEGGPPVTARPDLGSAVRKGTPSELRRDLYFWFMEGSWGRLFGSMLFAYVMVNVFFASLYVLNPGCIHGAGPDSFADAFFFSVQTLSTIGYGAMSPETVYGDVIVTIEAAVGLLGVALATGLLLAKASRPRAGVLFSRVLTLTGRHGRPALSFRVGNARGNEIVDATVAVTLLRDEITPEGEHLRRLIDLPLQRSRTPLFSLSWTVIHEVDEASPLAGVDWQADDGAVRLLVVTFTGHDGTYGQTVYSRHTYYREDVRHGARFVDVISQLPDGRLMVDYDRFHDTQPVAAAAAG